jgi:hypothetical protein
LLIKAGAATPAASIARIHGPSTADAVLSRVSAGSTLTAPWGFSLEIAGFVRLGYESDTHERLWRTKSVGTAIERSLKPPEFFNLHGQHRCQAVFARNRGYLDSGC